MLAKAKLLEKKMPIHSKALGMHQTYASKEGTGLFIFLLLGPSMSKVKPQENREFLEINENLMKTNIVDFAVLPDTCAHAHCFHNGRKILQYPLPTTKRFNSVLKSFAILHNHNSLLPNCCKK